jgi:hypothetical protein
MCNACGNLCCGLDCFDACGCDGCPEPDCHDAACFVCGERDCDQDHGMDYDGLDWSDPAPSPMEAHPRG